MIAAQSVVRDYQIQNAEICVRFKRRLRNRVIINILEGYERVLIETKKTNVHTEIYVYA